MKQLFAKFSQSIRWKLGLPVASSELEQGTDRSIADFYNNRVTECSFLDDPNHYEHPRAAWILNRINGGELLEIGCGNGGMTRLLSSRVDGLTAFDVSVPSLEQVENLGLPNVGIVQGLIENFNPEKRFDWIVLSEVIEHLREPFNVIKKAFGLLAADGSLLITTPNGHWESDEHLHEFSLPDLSEILAQIDCESLQIGYLRDCDNRRRWLTAILKNAATPAAADDFFDRKAIARKRKEKYKS